MEQNNFDPDAEVLGFLPEQYGAPAVGGEVTVAEATLGTAPAGDVDSLDPGIDGYKLKIVIPKTR